MITLSVLVEKLPMSKKVFIVQEESFTHETFIHAVCGNYESAVGAALKTIDELGKRHPYLKAYHKGLHWQYLRKSEWIWPSLNALNNTERRITIVKHELVE